MTGLLLLAVEEEDIGTGPIGLLIVLQLMLTYLPAMQAAFGTAALGLEAWGRIVLFGAALMLVVEGEKWLFRRWNPALVHGS